MPFGWSSPEEISDSYSNIIDTLSMMAEAYYYFGKLNDAIKLLKASQPFVEGFADEVFQSVGRLIVGVKLSKLLCASMFYQNTHLGDVLPTLLLTKEEAELHRQSGNDRGLEDDPQSLSDVLDCLGLAYYYHRLNTGEGDSSISLAYYQQALELRRSSDEMEGESESLFHIGLLYENGGQPDVEKALFYYKQAYESAIEHHDELAQSYAARHLGSTAETQGDFEQARRYYEESLVLREKEGFKISFPFSHLILGDLSFAQQEWDSASTHYQQAVSIAREMDTPIALIASLLSLGDLYQEQNEPVQALKCFEEALALARTYNASRWISEAASRIERLHS